MDNHKHRIPITAAQIIQFTRHVTFINTVCSTIRFGGEGSADVGFGGSKKKQSKGAFWTILVKGWRALFQ
jgi:hypothetical protein